MGSGSPVWMTSFASQQWFSRTNTRLANISTTPNLSNTLLTLAQSRPPPAHHNITYHHTTCIYCTISLFAKPTTITTTIILQHLLPKYPHYHYTTLLPCPHDPNTIQYLHTLHLPTQGLHLRIPFSTVLKGPITELNWRSILSLDFKLLLQSQMEMSFSVSDFVVDVVVCPDR